MNAVAMLGLALAATGVAAFALRSSLWLPLWHSMHTTFVVLMYHKISDCTCDALTVRQRDFAAQLHWLAQNGYTPISFAELIAYHSHQTNLPQKPIILSFDDNYHNNFVFAYPLLKQLGFKATVFVPVGYVGKTNAWDDGSEPLMSYETMRQMTDLIEFGIHSHSHKDYRTLTADEIAADIAAASRTAAESGFPYSPIFAYPYGGLPKNPVLRRHVKALLERHGFLCAARIKGTANALPLRDRYEICRIGISGYDTLDDFIAKLENGKA